MVMDMRHVRDEEAASDAPETVDAVEAEREPGLVDWIEACVDASDPADKARLITQLRLCVPSDEGISLLRDMVSSAGGARADSSSGAWTPSTVVVDGCRRSAASNLGAREPSARCCGSSCLGTPPAR